MTNQERKAPRIPAYGALQGVRVLTTGQAVAGPVAGRWLSDMGAEHIHIERPGVGDVSRLGPKTGPSQVVAKWSSLARNRQIISINLNFEKYPDSKEIFSRLLRQCDIWINNIPTLAKHGPSSEFALSVNPKLTVVQVTGFGMRENGGMEKYLNAAGYDIVGQAFGGFSALQGEEGMPPQVVHPFTGDFTTAMTAAFSAACGYINAQRTGKGQVIDVSMYEAQAYMMANFWAHYLNGAGMYPRTGNRNYQNTIFGIYRCRDGKYLAAGVSNPGVFEKLLKLLKLDPKKWPYLEAARRGDPKLSAALAEIWQKWLDERDADDAVQQLLNYQIAAAEVLDFSTAEHHPHWVSRNDFIEYMDGASGAPIKDLNVLPHFRGTPGGVWRGGPAKGQDSVRILRDLLDYDESEIQALLDNNTVSTEGWDEGQ